jgi:dUTPase
MSDTNTVVSHSQHEDEDLWVETLEACTDSSVSLTAEDWITEDYTDIQSTTDYKRVFAKVLAACEIQDTLNKSMASDGWKERAVEFLKDPSYEDPAGLPLDYCMAILDELVAELRPSAYKYEWWKSKNNLDLNNALLELVDIVHFAISHDLAYESLHENRLEQLEPGSDIDSDAKFVAYDAAVNFCYTDVLDAPSPAYFCVAFKDLTRRVADGVFDWSTFWSMAQAIGFTADDILDRYHLKAGLNLFRTLNGYKEGSYQKIWFEGKEDNFWLLEFAEQYKTATNGQYPSHSEIQEFLEQAYNSEESQG